MHRLLTALICTLILSSCGHQFASKETKTAFFRDRTPQLAKEANVHLRFYNDIEEHCGEGVAGCVQKQPLGWYLILVWNEARSVTDVVRHELWHVELFDRGVKPAKHHRRMRKLNVCFRYC